MEQRLPEGSRDVEAQMFFAFVTVLNGDPILSPQAQVFHKKKVKTSGWRHGKLNNVNQTRERIAWASLGHFCNCSILFSGELIKCEHF